MAIDTDSAGAETAMPRCAAAIDTLLQRRLAEWRGLPAGCRHDELAARLPLRDGSGTARLGEEAAEYHFRVLAPPGFVDPVFLYFAGGDLAIVRTDFWSLDAGECAALLAALGEPEHRLELVWQEGIIPGADRVWPGRGLAIGVIPETGIVARVALFRPGTLAGYRARVRSTQPNRELPPG